MSISFTADYNDDNKIVNFIDGRILEDTPEERVRQRFLKILHYDYKYHKKQIAIEVPILHGSQEVRDTNGNPVRADVVVYENSTACANRNQGQIIFIAECKAPDKTYGYNQLVSYIFNTNAGGGVWFNGSGDDSELECYRRIDAPTITLKSWPGFPRKDETWSSIGRRKKSELFRPKDIKGLFKRCHNKLYGRGTEEDDLTMDMVRIILAKAQDELKEGDQPEFYCTPEEYSDERLWANVEARVQSLFNEVKILNAEVFEAHERILVGARAICDVVSLLQDYHLLSDLSDSAEWDLMGYAYEEYTATYLKRRSGQFFTNRLVVDFLVRMIDPSYDDKVLDPAGGSGGFLTGSLRHIRNKIILGEGTKIAKQRQLDTIRSRLFMVESSKRLVKVAKTAMILNGDGHTGMTQGDSLGDFTNLNESILAQCGKGKPTVIFTNPPFAGVGEGRITDESTLVRFQSAKKWLVKDGKPYPSDEILTDGVPPEMLFFERCVEWLAPGGYLGIVLPKGFLDTNTYLPARHYMFSNCKLLAVINLHKNTFQPHTGVRTCLVMVQKNRLNATRESSYPIDNAIASDDLIRVIIPDENLRHYVYCYLLSKQAQDQLLRNEYGSIQQHLESIHVSNVLVPIPEEISEIESIISQSKETLTKKEDAYESSMKSNDLLKMKMCDIIGCAQSTRSTNGGSQL